MSMNSKSASKTFLPNASKQFLCIASVILSKYSRPFKDICVTSILWWFVCDACIKHRMLSTQTPHTMPLNVSTLGFHWFWKMGRLFLFISLDFVSDVSCAFVFRSNVILNSFYGFSKAILFVWHSVFSQHLAIGMTFFNIRFGLGLNKQFIMLRGSLKSFFM